MYTDTRHPLLTLDLFAAEPCQLHAGLEIVWHDVATRDVILLVNYAVLCYTMLL